ncbi:copper-translocating P-type ATPase [Xylariales sp. AK1849]|nr:copper-translocating P-type ATPase [Xylariales sp. AK1849]
MDKECQDACCSVTQHEPTHDVEDRRDRDCLDNKEKSGAAEEDGQVNCCSERIPEPIIGKAGWENEGCSKSRDLTRVTGDCQEKCCSGNNDKAALATEDCQDGCCSDETDKPNPTKGGCSDQCCSDNMAELKVIEAKCQEKCCSNSDNVMASAKKDCRDQCCSGQTSTAPVQDVAPPCCEGKDSPCCDDTCIERLAIRECDTICGRMSQSAGSESCAGSTPCGSHRATARERYSARLAALGCICRALIAIGQESCCISGSSVDGSRGKKRTTFSLGASRFSRQDKDKSPVTRVEEPAGSGKITFELSGCKDACCEGDLPFPVEASVKATSRSNVYPIHAGTDGPWTASRDPEKGRSGSEYVALSISGMTCTGCETKLQRVLGSVPAVSNLKTSLVLSRTEFNLDTGAMSAENIIKHLERTTEFKCERISTDGSNIDVVPTQGLQKFLEQHIPVGVNSMKQTGCNTVRINFDPHAIGARDLLERILEQPASLAPLTTDPGLAVGIKHVHNMGYLTLFSCVLTIPVLVLAWAPIQHHEIAYGATSLALATIIQFVVAGPFYPKALKSLIFSRMIEMDLLIVLSTSAAYIFSVISFGYSVHGQPLPTGEFFETSTLLVSLIMVGRWVSALARHKAIESISVRSLQTSMAQLVTADGTTIAEIDTRLFQYGDIFTVFPEQRIPTDGTIVNGATEVDESMLTGESRPIEKQAGDKVIAGSINGSGKLTIRLTRLPGENTISIIAGMVDNAKLTKPKIQNIADRVASFFVPAVILLTIVTFVVWVAVGIQVRKQTSTEACIQAITFAISVLIVSCPCAIGLAVPMVIVIGSGVAAERGVVFKSADSIEAAHKTTHVVFDKTGTLTEGRLKVLDVHYTAKIIDAQSKVLGLVANSKHPVSAAVATYLAEQGVEPTLVENIKTSPGKGVEGTVNGVVIRAGNTRWLEAGSDPYVAAMQGKGYTVFCATLESKLCAVIGLSDTIRSDAAKTVLELKSRGIQVALLSGDDDGAVQSVAQELGIDSVSAHSHCTPADKLEHIQKLLNTPSQQGKRATVVFVGDGTNDAAALAQATIGVHMNSGTDVAQSAADVVLMRPSLMSVVTMIDVSRASMLRIKFNFTWSFIYNVAAVLLASGALVAADRGGAIRIPPAYAGLGEIVSVLPVIAVAVGLKWTKF